MKAATICNCWHKVGLVGNDNTSNGNEMENDNEFPEYEKCVGLLQRVCGDGVELNVLEFFNPEGEDECTSDFDNDVIVSSIIE